MSVEQNMAQRKRRFKRKHHMLQLSFLLMIALVVMGVYFLSNPLRGIENKLDQGKYREAVDLYNRKAAGHEKREKKLNGAFENKITEIQNELEEGKITPEQAEEDLEVFETLDNKDLSGKAAQGVAQIQAYRENQALLEEINVLYEKEEYLEVMKKVSAMDPSADSYQAAGQLYDDSRDQLLSSLKTPQSEEDMEDQVRLLDSYLSEIEDPAFSEKKEELSATLKTMQADKDLLDQADKCMEKHDYRKAFKLLEDGIDKNPDNEALKEKLRVCHKIYVINASKDVSLAVSRSEFTNAKKIIKYAWSVYDSTTLKNLPDAVDCQRAYMRETKQFKADPELSMRFRMLATGWKEHTCNVKSSGEHSVIQIGNNKIKIDKTDEDELTVLKPAINETVAIANIDFIFDAKGVNYQKVILDSEDYYMVALSDSVAALLSCNACKEYFSYQEYITDAAEGSARFGKTAKK